VAELLLVKPTPEFAQSHASLIGEFIALNEELVPWVLDEVGNNFRAYVSWLEDQSRGVGLNEGFVPNSTFWLLEGNEIVGVSNIRHKLTPPLMEHGGHVGYGIRPSTRGRGFATKMLALSLLELEKFGISDVRITCSKQNIASAKTITHNGGVLESEEFMQKHGVVVQRYWIHHE
jgi:predicted acetyltransferase